MTAKTATPLYDVDDVVRYRDRHGRIQEGRVCRLDAHWSWAAGRDPLIVYSLHHPTYRNNNMYATAEDILGPATGVAT